MTEQEQKELLKRHVARHMEEGLVDNLRCPVCSNKEWDALPPVLTPVMPQSPATRNQAVPFGFLVCTQCGFARFFVWKVVEEQERGE